jgi:hypothetical protein
MVEINQNQSAYAHPFDNLRLHAALGSKIAEIVTKLDSESRWAGGPFAFDAAIAIFILPAIELPPVICDGIGKQ